MVDEQEELRSTTELVYVADPRWAGAEWGQEPWEQKRMEELEQEPGRWQVELEKKEKKERQNTNYHLYLSTVLLKL